MNLQEIRLKQILNYDALKKLFGHFSVVSGLDVVLYDREGNEELAVRRDKSLCSLVSDKSHCRDAIRYGGEKAQELGEPYIYQTACGLVMCASAVVFDGARIGSIQIGPAVLWDADDFARKEFETRLAEFGIQPGEIDIEGIVRLECVNMTSAAAMLSVLVDYLCSQERKYLEQRVEMTKFNAMREAAIAEMEFAGKRETIRSYPLELEKELIAYVHLGDKARARGIINRFLNEIFSYASGDLEIIKAKLYEFTAFLSRSAVEAGAPIGDLTEIVKKSSRFMLERVDFAELCAGTVEILDDFIDVVYKTRNERPTSRHLAKAIEYLDEHFCEDVTLETLAKNVFVSAYYLSHLFRDEMNTTFSDYLAKKRVEEAKRFLKSGMTVEQASARAGFKDSNYFTKIFKKYVGITPSRYRRGY